MPCLVVQEPKWGWSWNTVVCGWAAGCLGWWWPGWTGQAIPGVGLRCLWVESRQQDSGDRGMDWGRATCWTHALGVFSECGCQEIGWAPERSESGQRGGGPSLSSGSETLGGTSEWDQGRRGRRIAGVMSGVWCRLCSGVMGTVSLRGRKWVEVDELTVGQKMSQISQVMSNLKPSCSNEWLKIPVQFRHPWLCSPGMMRGDSLLTSCWRFIEMRAEWWKEKGYSLGHHGAWVSLLTPLLGLDVKLWCVFISLSIHDCMLSCFSHV